MAQRQDEDLDLELRLATLRDVDVIARMSRDHIETGLGLWQWHPRRVRRNLLAPETCAVIAASAARVHGFALMHFGTRQAHLYLLAVRPEVRRRGIGRRLLAWLEESARTAGTPEIYLEVRQNNIDAQRFYDALGYRPVRTLPGYYCGKETAVRLYRDLAISHKL